jgi:hypothetical protein
MQSDVRTTGNTPTLVPITQSDIADDYEGFILDARDPQVRHLPWVKLIPPILKQSHAGEPSSESTQVDPFLARTVVFVQPSDIPIPELPAPTPTHQVPSATLFTPDHSLRPPTSQGPAATTNSKFSNKVRSRSHSLLPIKTRLLMSLPYNQDNHTVTQRSSPAIHNNSAEQ